MRVGGFVGFVFFVFNLSRPRPFCSLPYSFTLFCGFRRMIRQRLLRLHALFSLLWFFFFDDSAVYHPYGFPPLVPDPIFGRPKPASDFTPSRNGRPALRFPSCSPASWFSSFFIHGDVGWSLLIRALVSSPTLFLEFKKGASLIPLRRHPLLRQLRTRKPSRKASRLDFPFLASPLRSPSCARVDFSSFQIRRFFFLPTPSRDGDRSIPSLLRTCNNFIRVRCYPTAYFFLDQPGLGLANPAAARYCGSCLSFGIPPHKILFL